MSDKAIERPTNYPKMWWFEGMEVVKQSSFDDMKGYAYHLESQISELKEKWETKNRSSGTWYSQKYLDDVKADLQIIHKKSLNDAREEIEKLKNYNKSIQGFELPEGF